MSARRRRQDSDGSLEMLLDTICNTFGVVVFISMLLVVQLEQTSRYADESPPTQESQADLIIEQNELEKSRHVLEQLKAAVAQQEKITSEFVSEESRRLAGHLRNDQTQQVSLLEKKRNIMSDTVSLQQSVNTVAENLERQRETLADLQEESAVLTRKLATEIASRSRGARFPEGHKSNRRHVIFFLKAGVLYRQSLPGHLQPSANELKQIESNGKIALEPIDGKGAKIDPNSGNKGEISKLIAGYSTSDDVLRVFFWPDSFREFQILRDIMVEQGFANIPEPVPENTVIAVGNATQELYEQ
jgi:hypothetical protein